MGTPLTPPQKGAEPPQYSAHVYCGQTFKMPIGTEVGIGLRNIVLDGDPAPSPLKGHSPPPNFRPICIVAKRLDGSRWHLAWRWVSVQPHCARWGPNSPPPKGGGAHQFSAHVYCGHMAAWIKMPLGTEVGLGPDNIVLDGDPAPLSQKGQSPLPNFWPLSIVAKRLDESRWHLAWRWVLVQATLYKVGSGDPSPFPQKRGQSPQFSDHFYCGQTAVWIKMPLVWR